MIKNIDFIHSRFLALVIAAIQSLKMILVGAVVTVLWVTSATANTYTFNGYEGNTGGAYPPPYAFGTLPGGDSTFTVTNNGGYPFQCLYGCNGGGNLFTFSLAADSLVSMTVSPGLHTEITILQIYNNNYGVLESRTPSTTQVVSGTLNAGDYYMGTGYYIPATPNPIYYETYSGHFSVTPIAAVPEPETYAMMLAGLGLLGFTAWRKKNLAA